MAAVAFAAFAAAACSRARARTALVRLNAERSGLGESAASLLVGELGSTASCRSGARRVGAARGAPGGAGWAVAARRRRNSTQTRHASATAPTQTSTTSATRPGPLGDWCDAESSDAPQTCMLLEFFQALSCSHRSFKLHNNARERRVVGCVMLVDGRNTRAAAMGARAVGKLALRRANFGCCQRHTEGKKQVRHGVRAACKHKQPGSCQHGSVKAFQRSQKSESTWRRRCAERPARRPRP